MKVGPLKLGFWAWTCVLPACSTDVVVLTPRTSDASMLPGNGDAALPTLDASMDGATPLLDGATPPLDAGLPPPPELTALDAFDQSCAAIAGVLRCWGSNSASQLGLGDDKPRLSPTRVGSAVDYVDVCAGEQHSCALRMDGTLSCWGNNLHGELGVGDFDQRSLPTRVEGARFVRVACGGFNTCAIAADGALYCWGDNFEGKGGQGDGFSSPDLPAPTRVSRALSFYDLSVGQGHVCAVTREGALYCWGRNTDGQLGNGSDEPQLRAPTRIGDRSDYRRVMAGQQHSCAITRDGRLFCWGTDAFGSLGTGVQPSAVTRVPVQVGTASDYRSVEGSWFHTCALRGNGGLYCWGRNDEGQLGLGDNTARNTPTRVGAGSDWTKLATGHFHTCGFRGPDLYCWGENDDINGQLGLGMPGRKNEPTQVPIP